MVAAADFGAAVAQYLVDWVEVARDFHGIQIDLLGFHNESPWQVAWFLRLREELDARGLAAVKLVAADCGPGPGFRKPCWLLHIAAQRSAAQCMLRAGYQTPDIVQRINADPRLSGATYAALQHAATWYTVL